MALTEHTLHWIRTGDDRALTKFMEVAGNTPEQTNYWIGFTT
jgi:hypothetical protein